MQKTISQYKIIKEIGRGAYAIVYLAQDQQKNIQVVIKQMDSSKTQHQKIVNNEYYILKLYTDNINKSKSIKIEDQSQKDKETIEFSKYLLQMVDDVQIEDQYSYLIFKSYENSIDFSEYLKQNHHNLSERTLLIYFFQLLSGLLVLHGMQIYHRDLKLENFLMCLNEDQLVILDFGFSLYKQTNEVEVCGSKIYSSPQVLLFMKYSAEKNDIWAMGIILYYLIHRRFPFCNIEAGNEEFLKSVNSFMQQKSDIVIDSGVSPIVNELLKKMLMRSEVNRPSIADVHAKLKQYLYGNSAPIYKFKPPTSREAQRQLLESSSNLSVLSNDLQGVLSNFIKKTIQPKEQQQQKQSTSKTTFNSNNNEKNDSLLPLQRTNTLLACQEMQQQQLSQAVVGSISSQSITFPKTTNNNISNNNENYSLNSNNQEANIPYTQQKQPNEMQLQQKDIYQSSSSKQWSQQLNIPYINLSCPSNQMASSGIKKEPPNLLGMRQNKGGSLQNVKPHVKDNKGFNQNDFTNDSFYSSVVQQSTFNTSQLFTDQIYAKDLVEVINDFSKSIENLERVDQLAQKQQLYTNNRSLHKQILLQKFYLSKLTHFFIQTLIEYYNYQKDRDSFCNYSSNFLFQRLNKNYQRGDFLEINPLESIQQCKGLRTIFDQTIKVLQEYYPNYTIFDQSMVQNQRFSEQTVRNEDVQKNHTQQGSISQILSSQINQQTQFGERNKYLEQYRAHSSHDFAMSDGTLFFNYISQFLQIMDYIEGQKDILYKNYPSISQTFESVTKSVKQRLQTLFYSRDLSNEQTFIKSHIMS